MGFSFSGGLLWALAGVSTMLWLWFDGCITAVKLPQSAQFRRSEFGLSHSGGGGFSFKDMCQPLNLNLRNSIAPKLLTLPSPKLHTAASSLLPWSRTWLATDSNCRASSDRGFRGLGLGFRVNGFRI